MSLKNKVIDFKQQVIEIKSIERLRIFLIEKKTQDSCHNPIYRIHLPGLGNYPKTGCRDSLGLKMKISKLVGDEILLETQFYESVRLEHTDPVGQKNLLEKLKQGISNYIKWGC